MSDLRLSISFNYGLVVSQHHRAKMLYLFAPQRRDEGGKRGIQRRNAIRKLSLRLRKRLIALRVSRSYAAIGPIGTALWGNFLAV